ncbi:MAG TPA: histidinol-phosphate transaminase [Gaiellaceae bacterium]
MVSDGVTDWSALVRPSLHGLDPYRPGPSLAELKERYGLNEVAKLNWNEGLQGPFPGVREAVADEFNRAWMYPEHAYSDFREAVAAWLDIPPELVVPGHGIQALIVTVAHAFIREGDAVVVPTPTYGLYAQVSAAAGASVERVPGKGQRHDPEALAAAATRVGARLVWLCDPNNPTGSLVAAEEWNALLEGLPERCAVVVDEAYIDYVRPERRLRREDDVEAGRPVVILRTFSKIFGLAGLRLGYAVAHESLAPYLDVVQEPFNVNRAALAAGCASLRQLPVIEERRRENEERRYALAELLREHGAEPFPSEANFLLVRVGGDDIELAQALLRAGLLVRPGHDFGMPGYIRVTIGPLPLMQRLAAEVGRNLAQLEGSRHA